MTPRFTLDEAGFRDLIDRGRVELTAGPLRVKIELCPVELPRLARAIADAIAARRPPREPDPELDEGEEEDWA